MVLYPESERAVAVAAGDVPIWTDGYDIDSRPGRGPRTRC